MSSPLVVVEDLLFEFYCFGSSVVKFFQRAFDFDIQVGVRLLVLLVETFERWAEHSLDLSDSFVIEHVVKWVGLSSELFKNFLSVPIVAVSAFVNSRGVEDSSLEALFAILVEVGTSHGVVEDFVGFWDLMEII